MRSAFVVESAFVAVEGMLIGTVLALVCSWSITLTDAFGSDIAFRSRSDRSRSSSSARCSARSRRPRGPARSASKIDPAVALRLAD